MGSQIGNLRKISIDELTVGMFVEDIIDDNGNLLMVANESIKNEEQIEKIRSRGVSSVFINILKGNIVEEDEDDREESGSVEPFFIKEFEEFNFEEDVEDEEYIEELKKAEGSHKQALIATDNVINAIKNGEDIQQGDINYIRAATEDVANSVTSNSNAMLSFTQKKESSAYEHNHAVNVSILVASTTQALGYSKSAVIEAAMGALLHDIGIHLLPEEIIDKPGKLTDREYALIKQHPVLGLGKVDAIQGLPDVIRKIILQHHERFDGCGYPFGIKGNRINEVSQITAVADVYDALTSDRPYRRAVTPQRALSVLYKGIGKDFSGPIVNTFTKNLGVYPIGSFVRLNCGIMGVVTRVDKESILTPRVLKLFNENGDRINKPIELNLREFVEEDGDDGYRIDASLEPGKFNIDPYEYIIYKL